MKKNVLSLNSQNHQISEFLKQGKTLTSLEALRLFGCWRLSGRIYDIRKRGLSISSRTVTTLTGKRVSEYYIK
jgi:hypothetical protein